jgi:cystathionine beta-lyase
VRLRAGYGVTRGFLPEDTVGASAADMDFGIPPAVRDRLTDSAEHEDFGYPFRSA